MGKNRTILRKKRFPFCHCFCHGMIQPKIGKRLYLNAAYKYETDDKADCQASCNAVAVAKKAQITYGNNRKKKCKAYRFEKGKTRVTQSGQTTNRNSCCSSTTTEYQKNTMKKKSRSFLQLIFQKIIILLMFYYPLYCI